MSAVLEPLSVKEEYSNASKLKNPTFSALMKPCCKISILRRLVASFHLNITSIGHEALPKKATLT
jgi:hypothetical protein